MSRTTQPIGIFDSGIGGLTVAHAIVKHLPQENIVYFGDTVNLPYGDKSASAIQQYAVKITDFLLQQPCKLILIACHSASAAAFPHILQKVDGRVPVMDVIDPVIQLLKARYALKRIGLIGTRQTVHSLVYHQKIEALNLDIALAAHATYLLAPAIEEFGNHEMIDHLLKIYLSHPTLQNIDALILACTHYPIIKDKILQYYDNRIDLIDSAAIVAEAVKRRLLADGLLSQAAGGRKQFYVSDYTDTFARHAKLFFGDEIVLTRKTL
ncbi:MAG: glutamate racemase [Gammaproteobacteria bacterium RIFCSPHIGHO2_12_FULL_42_10]|nr:MAG: glutamate racemase [Gammaproteobacteria bacterium RIFCSPHIGHO2_12_FULL_42_10]